MGSCAHLGVQSIRLEGALLAESLKGVDVLIAAVVSRAGQTL
jgi:hypothetical protein